MKIGFYGAAQTVTGSNYLLETVDGKVIIDCGMFQGNKELRNRNNLDFLFNPLEINAVIITHSHIDHIGLLPKLVKHGFKGNIYATKSTIELMEVLLLDSAHIQKMDTEWENKKRLRRGEQTIEPLYTEDDVLNTMKLVTAVDYHKEFIPLVNLQAKFKDAGHILGSSFLEIIIKENNIEKTITFTGDLGRKNQKIIRDPEISNKSDFIVIESTYGDRLHKKLEDTDEEIANILKEIEKTKGTMLIPAFALGRTQEMIYKFYEIFNKYNIHDIQIYVDSPMSTKVTNIYEKNKDIYDADILKYINTGKNPLKYRELIFCETKEDSMKLNETPGPKIIISSSGMCDAGRILHHLKHNIWQPNSHILFVGYQSENSLGKQIIDGAKKVKILGETLNVKAKVHTIGGLSAHADKNELLEWLKQFKDSKPKVFVVHGEPDITVKFSESVKNELGYEAIVPKWKQIIDIPLSSDEITIDNKNIEEKVTIIDEHSKWNEIKQKIESKLSRIDQDNSANKEQLKKNFLEKINLFIENEL